MRIPPRKPDFHASKHHEKPRQMTAVLLVTLVVAVIALGAMVWLLGFSF